MKSYNQPLSITKGGRTMVLTLLLFVSVQGAHAQTQSNPLYQAKGPEQTNPLFETDRTAEPGLDADSDDDGLLRVEGSVYADVDASTRASSVRPIRMTLALRVSSAGDDRVLRKRPGRTKYSNVTLEKHTADAAQTEAQDYNSSRSNNASRSSSLDGALEHTDDWIAARASAPSGLQVVLVSLAVQSSDLQIPTDVHSGRLTGVRRHTPVTTTKSIDAATPYLYKASVGEDGAFVFDAVAPGTYEVCVVAGGRYEFRGHVTVLK